MGKSRLDLLYYFALFYLIPLFKGKILTYGFNYTVGLWLQGMLSVCCPCINRNRDLQCYRTARHDGDFCCENNVNEFNFR